MDAAKRAIKAAKTFSKRVDGLRFAEPVTHVYNPLDYAWAAHEQYLKLISPGKSRILFLGMNPGPWGMAQTGVPFGQVAAVRDWLQITGQIEKPAIEHPKRPIEGFECRRSEVSGERLWGLFQSRFGSADAFFESHFVANYCPLVFMESSGKNRTPDKLPATERIALTEICDAHLIELISILQPEWLVGVGAYAEDCLRRVANQDDKITRILHPSPASPMANRGWASAATDQLVKAGVWEF